MGEWRYTSIILNLGTRWRWSASPPSALPRRTCHRCTLDRRLGGPQSRSGRCGMKKNLLPLPGIELRLLGRPVYSLFAVPTEIFRFFNMWITLVKTERKLVSRTEIMLKMRWLKQHEEYCNWRLLSSGRLRLAVFSLHSYPDCGGTGFLRHLITFYQTVRRHIPEDSNEHNHHWENVMPRIMLRLMVAWLHTGMSRCFHSPVLPPTDKRPWTPLHRTVTQLPAMQTERGLELTHVFIALVR
jgi:hypothetical protein